MNQEKLIIYINPNCSKSRETLIILEQHGKTPKIIDYLDNPPDKKALKRIIELLGISPREPLRTSEPAYLTANLDRDSASDEEILDAISEYPSILQRPIVVMGNRAVIGRPPERVLDLIS